VKSVRGHNNMGPNASLPVLRQTRATGSGDSIFYVSDYLRKRKRPLKGPQLLLKRYCLTVTNATAKRNLAVDSRHGEDLIKFTWRPMPIDITLSDGTGGVMSKFERLLVAGSTELPDCRCTAEMNLMAIVPVPGGDTEIRVFRCPNCSHELRLTAWRNDVSAT
jgi:hypothetical protein